MNISHLKEFTVLSKSDTYQAAAYQICISQSALSKHIQQLEDELGAPLFYYDRKKLHLSPFGNEFLPMALKILSIYDDSLQLAHSYAPRNDLTIGIDLSDSIWITKVLPEFKVKFPDYHIQCICTDYPQLEAMLMQGKISLICYDSIKKPVPGDFEAVFFEHDTLVALLPSDHPLAGQNSISVNQLKNDSFIEEHRFSSSYNMLIDLCRDSGFAPRIAMTLSRRTAQLEMVNQKMGVAIISKNNIDGMSLDGKEVSVVPLFPAVPLYYTFLTMAGAQSKPAKNFLDYIFDTFSSHDQSQELFSAGKYRGQ